MSSSRWTLKETDYVEEESEQDWSDKFLEFVNSKLANGSKCEKCSKKGTLGVLDKAVGHVTWAGAEKTWRFEEKRNYPFAIIMCKNCGHSSLFNLVVAGISPEDF